MFNSISICLSCIINNCLPSVSKTWLHDDQLAYTHYIREGCPDLRTLHRKDTPFNLSKFLLLQSGDVELNPGPPITSTSLDNNNNNDCDDNDYDNDDNNNDKKVSTFNFHSRNPKSPPQNYHSNKEAIQVTNTRLDTDSMTQVKNTIHSCTRHIPTTSSPTSTNFSLILSSVKGKVYNSPLHNLSLPHTVLVGQRKKDSEGHVLMTRPNKKHWTWVR